MQTVFSSYTILNVLTDFDMAYIYAMYAKI